MMYPVLVTFHPHLLDRQRQGFLVNLRKACGRLRELQRQLQRRREGKIKRARLPP